MGNGREFVDKNDAQIQKYLDKSVVGLHFYQDIWRKIKKGEKISPFQLRKNDLIHNKLHQNQLYIR